MAYHSRETLYSRINFRVDQMIQNGLVQETRRLFEQNVFDGNKTAAGAIGYKELLPYIRGEMSLEEATESLKTATRRYAKRQITWFSAKDFIKPLWCDRENGEMLPFDEIFGELCRMMKDGGF